MERQISIQIPMDLAQRLDETAESSGLGRSDLVRRALRLYLDGLSTHEPDHPFDRVRELAGLAYGGPPDLGEKHREHLRDLLLGR